jgi:2-hydroxy-3-keto-5-methylthiopentenyl-1-phosphate phosphatase
MTDPLTEEYLLPKIADDMIKSGTQFTLMPTDDQWFGVTYKEDKQSVIEKFRKLYEDGVYKENLYSDLCTSKPMT